MQHQEQIASQTNAEDELRPLNQPPLRLAGMFIAAAGMLSWMLATIGLAFGVPTFMAIFVDFDTELPGLTLLLIDHHMKLAVIATAMTVAVPIVSSTVKNDRARDMTSMVLCVAGMLLLAMLVIGMFLPLVKLIESVSA